MQNTFRPQNTVGPLFEGRPSTAGRAKLAMAVGLALSGAVMPALSQAQQTVAPAQASAAELPPIDIDYRGERVADPRYARDLQETPRVITVLSSDLLEQRGVTELREALRSVTGVSLQAGEGNPPSGDQFKIRGFNARDDLNVNGTRDGGNYFRDPFYVDQIEVIKGPNSAFGGRGSSGGTVNFVTKRPTPENRGRIEASIGTDSYFRSTVDLNRALDDNQAFRINVMGHSEDVPGRDVVEQRRYGIYGAYTWGFQSDTQITADYLHLRQNNIPDNGLPFDRRAPGNLQGTGSGRIAPVDFSNFYGHTDDSERVDVDQVGLMIDHAFNDNVQLRNQTRYSRVDVDRLVSSPRFTLAEEGTFEGATVRGDLKPRDQRDENFSNQTDLLVFLETGPVTHDLVLGAEVYRDDISNRRRPEVSGPNTDLANPARRTRPAAAYDGTTRNLDVRGTGVYLLDTIAINERFDVHGGVRYDRVKARASVTPNDAGETFTPNGITDAERKDAEWSYNLGMVFKPRPGTALFANYGTAFEPSATFDRNVVQLAGGNSNLVNPDFFDADPQKSNAIEIGAKQTVLDGLDLGAALFRTTKRNARLPNSLPEDNNPPSRQRVEGFELNAAGSVIPNWRLYAAYSYQRSKVLSTPPGGEFFVGQRLGGVPTHSFSLFTDYDITPRFAVGGGVQYVGDTVNNIVDEGGVLGRVDSFTVVDLSATYRIDRNSQVRLNLLNAFDERYISQAAEGSAQGIPGAGRRLLVTYRYDF